MTTWVISQNGRPLVVFFHLAEAQREYDYLSFHGDGYELTEVSLETTAGDYTRRDDQ